MRPPIRIREAKLTDLDIVVPIWLTTYRDGAGPMPGKVYYPLQRKKIYHLLSNSMIFIACDLEDENHIYGWVCGDRHDEAAVIHYVHVKEAFRRYGIARELLKEFEPKKEMFYTHFTRKGREVARRFGAVFNPYLSEGNYENRIASVEATEGSVHRGESHVNE
jgi:GNAT superfamily N-acetyltransferase